MTQHMQPVDPIAPEQPAAPPSPVTKSGGSAAKIAALLAAIAAGAGGATVTDLPEKVGIKDRPTSVQTVALEQVELPLSVQVLGATQAYCGDQVGFTISWTGVVKNIRWEVTPEHARASLVVAPDGRSATFANRRPDTYEITVFVTSPTHELAVTRRGLTLLPSLDSLAPLTAQVMPMGSPVPQANRPFSPKALAVETPPDGGWSPEEIDDFVERGVNEVVSDMKVDDAHNLGACFVATAARLDSGQLTGDALADVRRQAQKSLGVTYPTWEPFLAEVDKAVVELQGIGQAKTPEGLAHLLSEIGATLKRVE